MKKTHTQRGFTLVEMIVAVGLFAVVMLISVGALLSLVAANRKAQALQSVMNNFNIALDGVMRAAREGNTYYGGDSIGGAGTCGVGTTYTAVSDCPGGGKTFAFRPYGANVGDAWVFKYDSTNKILTKTVVTNNVIGTPVAITAPEVTIDDMRFFVVGTTRGDTTQPKVVIVIKGTAAANNAKAKTTFHIQATAVQRLLDL